MQGIFLHCLGGSPSFGEHQKAEGWGGRAGSQSLCVGPIPFWSPAACSNDCLFGPPSLPHPAKAWGCSGVRGSALVLGVAVTTGDSFLLPDSVWLICKPALSPLLPSEQWPYCSELPSRYREGRRHRPHWPAAGSVVTSLFPPIGGLSQSFHAGRVKAITFPSLPWRGKKSLSEATLTQRGAGARDFLLVFPPWKSSRVRCRACFPGKNMLTALMLCWMVKCFFISFFAQNWLIPTTQMLQLLPGYRSPYNSMAGRGSTPMPLSSICTGECPANLFINPRESSPGWVTPPQTQHVPKWNNHLPLSALLFPSHKPDPLESACCPSPPLGHHLFSQWDWVHVMHVMCIGYISSTRLWYCDITVDQEDTHYIAWSKGINIT